MVSFMDMGSGQRRISPRKRRREVLPGEAAICPSRRWSMTKPVNIEWLQARVTDLEAEVERLRKQIADLAQFIICDVPWLAGTVRRWTQGRLI
jgi:hypothetical protein